MNPFVFACITPHGSEILEALSDDASLMARTRRSMNSLGHAMHQSAPQVIVVLTPHGTRAEGQFAIANPERLRGTVEHHDHAVVMERLVDRDLARDIAQTALADEVPTALLNYATSEGPLSCMPLDWGAIIPLAFMPEVPVVVINPPRAFEFTPHLRFGASLARAAAQCGKRVGLIASCDWSHTHAETGPYGFHEAAVKLDTQVVACIESGNFEALAAFEPRLIEDAKPDGLWQTLVLAGAIPPHVRRVEVLSYEVPTYFGMICAAVHAPKPDVQP
ncbi:extradiol ring-cleavage dioxygenase [Deinococcus peraridilitoris]|nr:extradiol ring-cleavage dioxygenase [Deinococcus peraridilitoris]